MKKGQLLSQPFLYIFAIIVIGLILFFGFYLVNKLMGTACQVENQKFISDLKDNIDDIYSVGFAGSSRECAIISKGDSDIDCELMLPGGIKGICLLDATSGDFSEVSIKELKEELEALESTDKNLFFVANNEDCQARSIKINKVKIPQPICVTNKNVKIVIENTGNEVEIRKI